MSSYYKDASVRILTVGEIADARQHWIRYSGSGSGELSTKRDAEERCGRRREAAATTGNHGDMRHRGTGRYPTRMRHGTTGA